MFSITRSSITRLPALAVLISLAAFALLVVVGGSTARATLADGDVVLGSAPFPDCTPGSDVNCSTSDTGVVNTSSGGIGFEASGGVNGEGLAGLASGSSSCGVCAVDNTGNGVTATANSGSGVEAHSFSGTGVLAVADTSDATGILASNGGNTSATALKAQGKSTFSGKTSFSRSGTVTVAAGTSKALKGPIYLGSSALVLATIQGNQAGVYVQGVTHTSTSFTVHLNKNTPVDLPVGWFVVN